MKVYELIKDINKKVTIKDTRVMGVKKYYLSLYRANMVYMYDKGFISDPTVYDSKEILGNIVDMQIKHLTGVTGKVELNEDYVGYTLARYKDDEEISEFLSLLLEVVKYRNISCNLDKFYDDAKFSQEGKRKLSLNIVQSASRIFNKNAFDIDEGILKCFKPKEFGFKLVTLDEVIYKTALEELGIEDTSDESLFVEGLTREEEIKYSKLILNGLVKLDGKYSDKLVSWLKNNKWASGNKFSSQNEGLYNWVVYVKNNSMIEEQALLMNRLLDEGNSIVYMLSNGFYIVDNDSSVKYPVGMFSVVSGYEEDEILPQINMLEGYTGEVYSLEYLDSLDLCYVGCPIELFVGNNSTGYFIDKEQTEMKDSISWFKHMGANLSFGESHYREGVYKEGTLEDKLFKIVGDSERGNLIGYLKPEEFSSITDSMKKSVVNKL